MTESGSPAAIARSCKPIVPVTPAGVGVVETGSIAALVACGGDPVRSTAAVLLFSSYIYLLELPVGALAWIVWATKTQWRPENGAPSPPPQR